MTRRMEKTEKYYTLRYERSDGRHKAGEKVAAAADTVRIGQEEDCDVCFDNRTDFADELFAVVRPCRNTDGWQLVPCSPYVRTMVNGTAVRLVHYLEDGDRIRFEGIQQELLFSLHSDGKYNAGAGTTVIEAPLSRKFLVAVVAAFVLLSGLLGFYVHEQSSVGERRAALLDSVKQSVMQISVDSVYYLERTSAGTRVVGTYSYAAAEGNNISGTAFLTEDSLLVTARHCVEPWLNDISVMNTNRKKDLKCLPTRWALEAETYNQTHDGDTAYLVISVCALYGGENATEYLGSYKSNEFRCDSTRDNIIEKGDFYNVYYWRSILRGHNRDDMMLGDVASLKTNKAGRIALARKEDMERMLKRKQRLDFIGYPSYGERGMEFINGEVQLPYHSDEGKLIAHNGRLTHGYSGGPALVVKTGKMMGGGKVYAVGVVSVTDEGGGDRTYSVPITEIKREEEHR